MKPLIIYHADCTDGFCAAWLFHKVFPNAEFVPAQYGDKSPEIESEREVYILDFSYPRETMIKMNEWSGKKCIVLDHHKTAEEACKDLDFCTFDINKSGATLALEYLIQNNYIEKTPWLVAYVEDRDLWKWKLESSKDVNTAIRSYPMNFKIWDKLEYTHWNTLAMQGEAINRYRDMIIEQHILRSTEIILGGKVGHGCYCSSSEFISEIAGELAEEYDFGACWFNVDNNKRVYSLRSRGDIDVSDIAKSFGGGGHKNAAGFTIPI